MNDRSTEARREAGGETLKPHVHLAVEALKALGRIVAPPAAARDQAMPNQTSSCDVSLAAMRILADALAEQIAHAMRHAPRASDRQPPSAAQEGSVTPEEFAARLERHVTARHSDSIAALTPAERIRRFVESHYTERLTLQDIAAAIGCARSLVAAIVKHQLGATTHQYIARMRIRRAADLIAQGDKIEAVMLSVGYRSKKNFYRQFKIETGLTPAAYRRLRPATMSTAAPEGTEPETRHVPGAPTPPCAPARRAVEWDYSARGVTISGASELLGVSRRTVYYWIKNGKLQTIRPSTGGRRIVLGPLSGLGLSHAPGGK